MKFLQGIFLYAISLSVVIAAEWGMEASVDQSLAYDDNVEMAQEEEGSFIYRISPRMNFFRKTEVSEIHTGIHYGLQRYFSLKALNSHSQQYNFGGSYLTERTRSGFNFSYSIAPARDTAEEESGDFSSSGGSRSTYSLAPSFTYQLTELDSLSFSPNYSKTTYASGGFSNNTSSGASLALNHRWTERLANGADIFYSKFDSSGDNQSSTSHSYGANLSAHYDWSETFQFSGSLGIRMTDSFNDALSGSINTQSTGFLSNLGVNYKGEYYGGSFAWSRSLVPSAQGALNNQDRLSFEAYYTFTARLSSRFSASYQRSESITETSGTTSNSIRENIVFSPTLNWAMTPDWRMAMSYSYRSQRQENSTDANLFMLSINYKWPGLSLSR
jgi:hypothetical protein